MVDDLKIAEVNQKSINILYKLAIFWFFTVISIATLRQNQIFYWSSYGIMMFTFFVNLLYLNLKLNKYLLWFLTFFSIVMFSMLWAYQKNWTIDGIKSVFVMITVYVFISNIIENERNFYEVLKLFVFSKIITAAYIIISIDISSIGVMRIGIESLGEQWNANNIGMSMAISAFLAFAILKKEKSSRTRLFYYFLISLFGIITLLTGSRKALFVLLFAISLYAVLNARSHKYFKAMLILVAGITVLYLTMNVPILYDVMGSRIETMLNRLTGQGVVDRSTRLSMEMIDYGMHWFGQKPILGYGINNFRALYGDITGNYTYAHNNYVDLLVGVGALGTLIYYLGHLYIIKKSINRRTELSFFALTSIVTILIIDVGLVSYDSFYVQFIICMCFTAIRLNENRQKTLNNPEL